MNNYADIQFIRKPRPRDSQFELLRICAQFFIVFYHLLMYFVFPITENTIHKALWIPFHIGVILFILISGYYGIHSSIKGLVKLIGMMFVLYIPLQLTDYFIFKNDSINIFKIPLFISCTPFWFMRTYVFLYIFAPVINKYLVDASLKNRLYLLSVLFFISYYVGLTMGDPSLLDGKNLPTFLFFYTIGNTLYVYKEKWKNFKFKILITLYLFYNIILVIFFTYGLPNRIINALFVRLFFSYCSVGLLINALLFFFIIGKLKFHSKAINWIAKSSLTIYMVHCSSLVLYQFIEPLVIKFIEHSNSDFILLLYILSLTICIIIGCVIVDNLLNPIWNFISIIGTKFEISCNKFLKNL